MIRKGVYVLFLRFRGELEVKDYKMQNKKLLEEFKKCKEHADKLWTLVKEEN